jgi:hypothetical protein
MREKRGKPPTRDRSGTTGVEPTDASPLIAQILDNLHQKRISIVVGWWTGPKCPATQSSRGASGVATTVLITAKGHWKTDSDKGQWEEMWIATNDVHNR